ncbi:hypothetical protein [Pseudomonas fluorescens]|uniref:hypothetical protein n=1 Tax=Pseudomonas fluorescens TaxID=294 RepID=UPI00054C7A5B|nr:hypothetical protein [Pseudomonas fluorescens]KII36646.1 hypothetical protein RY26_06355 [Pseudomonas fluorescens]
MSATKERVDFSRFLVHLTKDSEQKKAKDILLEIYEDETIEARNHHCLFGPLLKNGNYTSVMTKKFNTVCFTETPLNEINKIARYIPGRSVKLAPYGLVFWRDLMIEDGASQAIYINSKGTDIKDYLIAQFKEKFSHSKSYKNFQQSEPWHNEAINYYSLINIISDTYDFSWEREWRFCQDFHFKRRKVAAIIASNPADFEKYSQTILSEGAFKTLKYTPIIDPIWGYEEMVEEMSHKLWSIRNSRN